MSTLYLFGIGGTGSRVIRSLAMLLASGVDCGNFDTIVPVIIDPDEHNGDMERTIRLLETYEKVHAKLDFGQNSKSGFFKVDLQKVVSNYRLPIANVSNKKFSDFIDYSNLSTSNKALIDFLFSEDNLNSSLQVGFKGNPNMGSIVLNDFGNGSLRNVLSNFQQGDRIFIISSIFGGTGAAGFPLLLSTLRQAEAPAYANAAFIANAPIGAITVLPYFGLESTDDNKVQMESFVSKAKAALSYYENSLDVNALYYITDDLVSTYDYHEGDKNQINKAHFVEFASALAIIDFLTDSEIAQGQPCVYKEFAVQNDKDPLYLSHLSPKTLNIAGSNLMQLFFFEEFYDNNIHKSLRQAWAKGIIDETVIKADFYQSLDNFLQQYKHWQDEMGRNKRSFEPFNLEGAKKDMLRAVNIYEPKKAGALTKIFHLDLTGYYALADQMDIVSAKLTQKMNDEDYFMSVFYQATEQLIKKYFN